MEIERTNELTLAGGGVDDALVVDAGAIGIPATSIALCTEKQLHRLLGILLLEYKTYKQKKKVATHNNNTWK